jgi:hypothetical protein
LEGEASRQNDVANNAMVDRWSMVHVHAHEEVDEFIVRSGGLSSLLSTLPLEKPCCQ